MNIIKTLQILLLVIFINFSVQAKPLKVSETQIKNSVLNNYPLILAGYDKIEANKGKLQSSNGAFDIKLKQEYLDYSRGFYDGKIAKTTFEKQNNFLGSSVYGGYRKSSGEFEDYENKRKTAKNGEFFAGVNLPLLQGRAIDQNRLGVMLARYDFKESKIVLDKIRIKIQQDALKAYWNWISTANIYKTYDSLYKLSQLRDKQLRQREKNGDIAEIIVVENKQNLLTRKNQSIRALMDFKNSSIYLSLFYRDNLGQPIILDDENLPNIDFSTSTQEYKHNLESDIENALGNRAEVALIRLNRKRQTANLNYSENLLQPELDLNFEASKDTGSSPDSISQSRNTVGVKFTIPLQFSKAKGQIKQARSELSAISYEEKNIKDSIKVELRQIHTSIINSTKMLKNLKEEVLLAHRLEQAERQKFKLGSSNFFLVNYREQISANSKIKKITAWQKLQDFKTDYKAARFNF